MIVNLLSATENSHSFIAMKKLSVIAILLFVFGFSNAQIVTTFAGSVASPGNNDGTGTAAGFIGPSGVTYDGLGNLYVTDAIAQNIRMITLSTGAVTTVAGSTSYASGHADGTGTAATFNQPAGITYDGAGNLYVADYQNNEIRTIVVSTGAVTTFAGSVTAGSINGTGTAARFKSPSGVAYDGSGNLFIADTYNNEIRKIVISTGVVTTFAGSTSAGSADGIGTAAGFTYPSGIAYDGNGNLYVSEVYGYRVRKIVIATDAVTTIAGSSAPGSIDGIGTAASFNQPAGITYDGKGNLFLADQVNNEIRMITTATGAVVTFAGTTTSGSVDGTASFAGFSDPAGVVFDGSGNLYVTDKDNYEIRKITTLSKPVTAFAAGNTTPCAGVVVQFTDNSTNVPLTWMWTFQDGASTITSTLQNPGIAFNTPGKDSVKLVVTNYGGKDSITKKLYINVNALPTVGISENIIGGSLACGSYDTLRANASGSGVLNYIWSTSGTRDTIIVSSPSTPYTGIVTTIAGSTTPGYNDGTGTVAQFTGPAGAAYDGNGNLFIVDQNSNEIRKLVLATGVVTTFAGTSTSGSADGIGAAAGFKEPTGIACDGNGNLYVADYQNNEIRKVVIATGAVTTFAGTTTSGHTDGTGTAAGFSSPTGVTYDGNGNLYVADQSNFEIRKIVLSTGAVTTIAGSSASSATLDGTGTAANFYYPYGIVSDGNGNLYVTEQYGNDVRKIVIATAVVTTIAGSNTSGSADGIGAAAGFYYPTGIAYDGFGNLYVTDNENNEIRRIVTSSGAVTTFAGTTASGSADGSGTTAGFYSPDGVAFDAGGNLYVADQNNYEIRKISVPNFYSVTVTDGNGCKNTASASATVYPATTISITGGAQCTGIADTLIAHATGAGSLSYNWAPVTSFSDTNIVSVNNIYTATVIDANGCTATASKSIVLNSTPTLTISENIMGGSLVCGLYDTLKANAAGNGSFVYGWSTSGTHDTIIVSSPPAPNLGKVSTLAGSTTSGSNDGTGTAASLYNPTGIVYDGNGNLYVTDQYNQEIRKVVIPTGAVTTFAGSVVNTGNVDGTGTAASFNYPTGIAYDGNGNLYVADQYNNEIRKVVIATGSVSTFAGSTTQGVADGTGTAAEFNQPTGIVCDGNGNLFVADWSNNEIRKIVIATGAVSTFAGSLANSGTIDGTGTAAGFTYPYGITYDGNGNLYVTEQYGNDIRKIVISTAVVTTFAGSNATGSIDGIGTAASFNQPQGITYDGFGNLYVGDGQNNEIRKIVMSTDAVSTIAGTTTSGSNDGTGTVASLYNPAGLGFDASGNLYVADQQNNEIRKIGVPNFYAVTVTDKNGCKSTASASALVYPGARVTISGGTSCIGSADTLIAHAIGTGPSIYSWSPAATGDTNLVFSDNVYSVTITDSVGCKAMASKSVIMNPTPTVTISGNTTICSGINDTLIANATGIGTFKYLWNNASTKDTIIATLTTVYSVTVIDNNGCGSIATKSVTADSLFAVGISSNTTGGAVICSGSEDTLVANAAGTGAFTYKWNTSETQDTIITSSAGIYSVTVVDALGCRDTASIRVVVNSLPTISVSGFAVICSGIDDTLTANATGNGTYTYKWNTGGTSDTILVKSSNTYNVLVTDTNGCQSNASVTVTINPTPTLTITGNNQLNTGNADTLTATGAATYSWNTGSTSDTAIVKPTISSKYTVIGKGADGCIDTASFMIVVTGVVDLISTDKTILYPNPTLGDVNLSFEMQGAGKHAVIGVIDAIGKEVMSENSEISNGKVITLNVTMLAQGIYFVKVTTDNEMQVVKFIKQ
jgi:PKD repeat protein